MCQQLLNEVLTPAGVYDLDVQDEDCAECRKPLADNGGEELAGLIGEDADGLPGFVLMHGPCLTNRLLRLLQVANHRTKPDRCTECDRRLVRAATWNSGTLEERQHWRALGWAKYAGKGLCAADAMKAGRLRRGHN